MSSRNSQTLVKSFRAFLAKTTRAQHPNQIQFDSSLACSTQAALTRRQGPCHLASFQGDQLQSKHPGKKTSYLNATETSPSICHQAKQFFYLLRLPSLFLYPIKVPYSGVVSAWPWELTFQAALSSRHRDRHRYLRCGVCLTSRANLPDCSIVKASGSLS